MTSRPVTPGYNIHLEIAFTADRNGRPVAYRWSPSGVRWLRIAIVVARDLVAQGLATEVRYVNFRKAAA